MINNQPEQNQQTDNQKINKILNPDDIDAIGRIANQMFADWKNFETQKAKNIHTYSLVTRYLHFGFLFIVFIVLSILAYNNTITETIFATLISSIIGYLVGSNRTTNGNK